MPGDTGRGGAAPRRTRATGRASGSTGVETRRAGNRSAQVPAPAPESADIESGASAQGEQQVLTGEAVGATGQESSSSGDEYSTAQQDTPARGTGQAAGVENISQDEGGAAEPAGENPGEQVRRSDRDQARIRESEQQEAEALSRARDTVRRRRRGGADSNRDIEINLVDTDDEFDRNEEAARPARRNYRNSSSWGAFSSDEEEDEAGEPTGVPYYPSDRLVRPERIFRRQDFGKIEAVNLFQTGEYEQVIPGFSDLTPACQFEVEYVYPVAARLHDILRELMAVEGGEPGRIPGYIAAEIRGCYDLLEERIDGQMERAKCASGKSTEGFTLDAALAIMLELRDARMESGAFREGAFGKAKQETAKRVRLARAKLRASRQAFQAEGRKGGGRWKSKWKSKQANEESPSEAAESDAESKKEGGKPSGGKGRGRGRGRFGGGRTS
eukprot:SAG31_NODE_4254_length_3414_cov_5.296833_2_plen_443_part_00